MTAVSSWVTARTERIYCPGSAGGDKQVDRLASTADITTGRQLGRTEVLGGLGNLLKRTDHSITASILERKEELSEENRSQHHSIDLRKERGTF